MTPPTPARSPRTASAAGGQPPADPAVLRRHLAALLQTGTFRAVAAAAQLGEMTVWEIARATRPAIRRHTANSLLAVRPADVHPPRTDAGGAMWRLRSLMAMGHSAGRITAALGVPGHVIAPLIRGDRATIAVALHQDITRLFDAWWDKQPPRRTPQEKASASRALRRAAAHGWPCPAALDEDDLDQPGYQPSAAWRPGTGTGVAGDNPLAKTAGPTRPRPGTAAGTHPHLEPHVANRAAPA
jgi:hypothetical protein